MSQVVEIPDTVYSASEKAAQGVGTTPAGWIAAQLAKVVSPDATPNQTLADRFAGRTGRIRCEGQTNFSEQCGEQFTDYVEAKKLAGHL